MELAERDHEHFKDTVFDVIHIYLNETLVGNIKVTKRGLRRPKVE